MWGSKEYSRFVVITTVLSNLSVYLYYRFKGLFVTFTEPPPVVLSTTGICIGLLIALKQRIGNHYLILFKGNLRIKVKFLPILVFILTFLLQLIDEEFKIYFLLTTFGTIISWTYLRFYKSGTNDSKSYLLPFYGKNKKNLEFIHIDNGSIKGDRSELFSFYTFFPYPFSSIVKILSLLVFNYFVKLGFFNPKDFGSDEDENDYVQEDINNLQSHFVGLSTLKGAGTVTTVPQASATLHKIWNWLSSSSNNTTPIKSSMDKRRKMALRELA